MSRNATRLMNTSLPRLDRLEKPIFTYAYAQPVEYRFCQDSVLFPWWLARHLRARPTEFTIGPEFRALDVCAGCGVIGFELAFHLSEIKRFDFMELQQGFRESFDTNVKITGHANSDFRLLLEDFARLSEPTYHARYDLIVANPPYFFAGDGKLTSNELKNRCRFFLDGSLESLVRGVINALKTQGEAYLLVKPGEKHGRDNFAVVQRQAAALGASATAMVNIRGTWVVRVSSAQRDEARARP